MIQFIKAEETLPLRSRVLRNNQPLAQCRFSTDNRGFHLGYFENGQLVSVATFFEEDLPELGAGGYRLRGMATSPEFSGRGYGSALIKFAIDELKKRGAAYIWCNARSSALGFYLKLNFLIRSETVNVPDNGAHYNMSLQLNNI